MKETPKNYKKYYIIGNSWCPACVKAKEFLTEQKIDFIFLPGIPLDPPLAHNVTRMFIIYFLYLNV